MKKTDTGYSVKVFVNDGEVAAALYEGIQKFFAKVELQRHPDRCQSILKEVDYEAERIKESTPV